MACTAADVLEEIATTIAAMVTSRDAAVHFSRHESNEPFRSTPLAGIDGFDVELPSLEDGPGFGRAQQYQTIGHFRVVLGHAPFEVNKTREKWAARDAQRVADVLEKHVWTITTVDGCFLEGVEQDKADANWWLTALTFRITFWGNSES